MRTKNIKVSLMGIVLFLFLMLCACGNKTEAKEYDFMESVRGSSIINSCEELRDTETGVHYFKGNNGGICPRYNADGTMYVD